MGTYIVTLGKLQKLQQRSEKKQYGDSLLRPPPIPSPPASLFTTKSATFKALQTTAIPVRTGLVCLKPSVCARRTLFDMRRNICLDSFRDTHPIPRCLNLHSTRSQGACSAVYAHGVPHSNYSITCENQVLSFCFGGRRQIYVYTVSPTKQWKTDECHRKLKKNVANSRKATEN